MSPKDEGWEPVENEGPPPADDQTLEEWWREDADRLNKAGELIRKRGLAIDVTGGESPPELNPDGSLAGEGADDGEG